MQQRQRDFDRTLAATRFARNAALDQLADAEGYIAVLEGQITNLANEMDQKSKTIANLEATMALRNAQIVELREEVARFRERPEQPGASGASESER